MVKREMGAGCKYRRSFTRSLLTSYCMGWFLTGHRLVLLRGLGVGDPCSKDCALHEEGGTVSALLTLVALPSSLMPGT